MLGKRSVAIETTQERLQLQLNKQMQFNNKKNHNAGIWNNDVPL